MPKITGIDHIVIRTPDVERSLAFYTEVLGFVKKTDIPLGDASWLTVVSTEDPNGTELLLEPDGQGLDEVLLVLDDQDGGLISHGGPPCHRRARTRAAGGG